MFALFADLISFHLQQIELLEQNLHLSDDLEQQVQTHTRELQETVYDLQRSNENLQQFAYIASHDLQEPLRKIQSFSDLLQTKRSPELGEDIDLLTRMQQAAKRMSTRQEAASPVLLNLVVDGALNTLEIAIYEANAQSYPFACRAGDKAQLEQLFQNLLSNALKFRRADVPPQIRINTQTIPASELPPSVKPARKAAMYHRIDVTDNGIGFDAKYLDRVF